MIFDFTDDVNVWSMFRISLNHQFSKILEIFKISRKWNSNIINLIFESKLNNIHLIILIDGGQCNNNARKAHILLLAKLAIILNFNNNDSIFFPLNNGTNAPISKENFLSNIYRSIQILIRTCNSFIISEESIISCFY